MEWLKNHIYFLGEKMINCFSCRDDQKIDITPLFPRLTDISRTDEFEINWGENIKMVHF